MSSVETGSNLSYVRAFREVLPSASLKQFLQSSSELIEGEVFEGVTDPLVYAAASLRVTLFERRAQASQDVNDLLRKLHIRMESPTIKTTRRVRQPTGRLKTTHRQRPNPLPGALSSVESVYVTEGEPLLVRANRIVDCTKGDYRALGTELALVIDEGSGAAALEAQHDILSDAAGRLNAGKRLPRPDESSPVLYVPFMRAPFSANGQRDEFMELLSTELPVHEIGVGPIEWQLKTVSH